MTTSVAVLYVEDNPEQGILMKALLEIYGFQVTTAESALEGLTRVTEQCFDIALLDYDLPDMTGAQLAQECRGLRPTMPIVILSGRGDLSPGELVYADAFLLKGSSVDELVRTICSVVSAGEPQPRSSEAYSQA